MCFKAMSAAEGFSFAFQHELKRMSAKRKIKTLVDVHVNAYNTHTLLAYSIVHVLQLATRYSTHKKAKGACTSILLLGLCSLNVLIAFFPKGHEIVMKVNFTCNYYSVGTLQVQ